MTSQPPGSTGLPGLPRADRCLVMGVVNVTPDSFSDGGQWFGADAAIAHGLELAAQGADIVDVGGETSAAAWPIRTCPAWSRRPGFPTW